LCIVALGWRAFYVAGYLNLFPEDDPIGDILIVSSGATLDISRVQVGST
jgi:hypothetical protein